MISFCLGCFTKYAPSILHEKEQGMKYIIIIVGSLLLIGSMISLGQYIFSFGELSQYEKGFIWGKILLFAGGLFLVRFGFKNLKTAKV